MKPFILHPLVRLALIAIALVLPGIATTLHMRCIQINGVRYTLTVEFPNAHAELVAANKDKFFDSFKLKAKS